MSKELSKEDKKDLEQISKSRKDKMSFGGEFKTFALFVKRLFAMAFALSILGLGLAAVWYAKTNIDTDFYKIAVIVSGACAIVNGFYLLYMALMKMEK